MPVAVQATMSKAAIKRMERKLLEEKLYKRPVEELMTDAADIALREAQSNAKDLGGIPAALHAEVRGFSAKVGGKAPGIRIMEFGRKPLAAGGKFPPPAAFARYGDERERFVIASAVAHRGVKGRFFIRKARAKLQRSEFGRLIKLAKKAIKANWMAP